MFKKIRNEDGSIMLMAAAIIVSVVSLASSWSMIGLVRDAELQKHYDHDAIQEELFLRTESTRTHIAIEFNRDADPPDRKARDLTIEDKIEGRHTEYYIENKSENKSVTIYLGQATEQAVAIKSRISAKHEGEYSDWTSPVKRMTEKLVRNESLAQYQYFTSVEKSENSDIQDDIVKFYGADDLYGPVHSNDDIWIQNSGGWPTFYAMVTTSGRVRVWPNGELAVQVAPVDQIFLGGLMEEVPPILFEPDATELHQNATMVGYGQDIVYMKLDSGGIQTMYGQIVDAVPVEFEVYSWYPHEDYLVYDVIAGGGNWYHDADHIWTNEVAISDTVWVSGPPFQISPLGSSFFCPTAELWVEGSVSGKCTLGSAKRVYIVGDITYAHTTPGQPPDDENNPNEYDYFGLVSEERMMIRYKHYDPFQDFLLRDENCNDVRLYGAFAAIGEGDEDLYGIYNCHYEGIFTFQYQHPHGSTPSFDAPSPFIGDDFTITLFDDGSNGWEGAFLDLYVNGDLVLDDITCNYSQNTEVFYVNNGDIIETVYYPGSNEDENSYVIYDEEGNLLISDGPPPGAGVQVQALIPPDDVDSTYTYIDLHKYIFPISNMVPPNVYDFNLHGNEPVPPYYTCGYPYEDPGYVYSYPNTNSSNYAVPYGTDYPWYNPIWPESAETIVMERGDINIWGAVAQRRRGFVHRSGSDPYNHPGNNKWELDETTFHYDGEHPSTGYDKNYHYDNRFLYFQPPDYPQVYEGWGNGLTALSAFNKRAWGFYSPAEW